MSDNETTNNENVNTEENTSETITEEWVDDNVIGNNSTDDSVTDCCCDKRVTIDNGNWCIKLPRRVMTVKESIGFLDVIEDLINTNLPHFGLNYDGFYDLVEAIDGYKSNALSILYDNDCIDITDDLDYNSNKI